MSTKRDASPPIDRELLRLLAVLVVGILPPVLDTTVVNIALDTMGRALHSPVADIQWVLTGYLLALAMAIPLTTWSVARFGAKRMWMSSLFLFLAGSVACGLAWDLPALIAFRVVQGVGGGLLIPIMQTLLVQAAGGRPLGRLMAVVAMPALVGPILGPVVGGVIVSHLSWRWIFYVNLPICLLALVMAWRGLPRDEAGPGRRLDVVGLALLSPALAAMIYGLAQIGPLGGVGHTSVVAPLTVGAALLVAFGVHAVRTRTDPIVDLRLFRHRSFAASSALMFLSGLSLYSAMLLLPLYYQRLRGADAVEAGLLLAPQGIASLLLRTPLGKLTDRLGPRPVIFGCTLLTTVGTLGYVQTHANEWILGAFLALRGAGLGGTMLAIMVAAYEGLERSQIPHASSLTRITQQVGGSFGSAVLAVILQRQLAGHSHTPSGQATAFAHTFWWTVAFSLLAFLPALFLPRAQAQARARPRARLPSPPSPPSPPSEAEHTGEAEHVAEN
jgi:EmrB/QacA subfamily drug resistance transporter